MTTDETNIKVRNIRKERSIMFKDLSDLITIDDLCEALAIGRNMAYRLLNSGEIKAFRCGRVWKIPREAVEQYVRVRSGL
jgi:excisionase family DNA binding protein